MMFDAAVRERSDALVKTLLDSVRIASVSLTGEGIDDQVGFLQKRLQSWGFAVEVHRTSGNPIIYAEIGPPPRPSPKGEGEGERAKGEANIKTELLDGHYDV